jgi:hypothetical protein
MDWKEKLAAWREFYDVRRDYIKENKGECLRFKRDIRRMVERVGLSPIESMAFEDIMFFKLPIYPQYPLFSYFPDFCDPVKKIIIECDGKDFHNTEKDTIRDEGFAEHGYKIFRIKGSMFYRDHNDLMNRIDELESRYIEDLDELEMAELKEEFFSETAFGLINSISNIYYDTYRFIGVYDYEHSLASLGRNRIVDFKLIENERH